MKVNLYTLIDGAPAASKTVSMPIKQLTQDIRLLRKELVRTEAGSPYEFVEIIKDGKQMMFTKGEIETLLADTHGVDSVYNVYTKKSRFGLPFETRTVELQAKLNRLLETRTQAQKRLNTKYGYFSPTPIGSFLNESIARARAKNLSK